MKPIETFTHRGCTIQVFADEDPSNPRKDCENFGHMICWHRKYILGDEQPNEDPQEYLANLAGKQVKANDPDQIPDEHVKRILEKYFTMLPLNLYDHGGITMSTGSFSCQWDSGCVGFIYVTLKDAKENWSLPEDAGWDYQMPDWDKTGTITGKTISLRAASIRLMEQEVEIYDDYLTGQVYGYKALDWQGNDIDSCWGFLGYEESKENGYMISEAKSSIDHYIDNLTPDKWDSEHDEHPFVEETLSAKHPTLSHWR